MKKNSKLMIMAVCATMVLSTGCSFPGFSSAKTNSDYVKLGNYKTINLKKATVDSEVKAQVDSTLQNYVTYKKVKSGKVKSGDTVNIFYVGKINGKAFANGSCTKKTNPAGQDLKIGSNSFIPGFETGLIGKKVGKTVDLHLTFPKTYTANTKLAGKKTVFTVTINYVQGAKITPKVTDAFVKKNLTGYTSAADFQKKTKDKVVQTDAWNKVYNASKVKTYPKARVTKMYNQLYKSVSYYLKQNNYSIKDYVKAQNITEAKFKAQLKTTAKEDVGKQIVYGAIAEKEDIKVSDKTYKKQLKTYLKTYNCKKESDLDKLFKQYYGSKAKNIIKDDLLFTKVKEYLVKNVKES